MLKLCKRQKSPYWYVRGTVKGQYIFESTGILHAGKEKPQPNAERELLKRQQYAEDLAVSGKAYAATYEDAAHSYLDAGGSPRFQQKLIERMGHKPLRDFTQSYLTQVSKEIYPNCKPETLNRQFYTPFISVWNYASRGLNPLCPTVKWERPKGRKLAKVRRPEEYENAIKFINDLPPHAAKIMFFLFWTGARPIEALELECKNVDIAGRWIVFEDTKNGQSRGVPMHECLVEMMTEEIKKGGKVFRTQYNKPYYAGRVISEKSGRILGQSGGQLKSTTRKAQKRTGLHITPYTARHTVSSFLAQCVSSYEKDEILGHAPENRMSSHYVHTPKEKLITAINNLPDPYKLGLLTDKIRAPNTKYKRNQWDKG